MKNFIKICLTLLSICSTADAAQSNSYVPKSGGILPSIDFVKRFGKHCTTHKNLIGRQVFGLCDDANLCNDVNQYKACYKNCIQNRKKEDEKTTYIFGKLAACHQNIIMNGYPTKIPGNVIGADKDARDIFNQANLRLNSGKYQTKSKTFEMPADLYQPERTSGINSFKSINPFSTNCTTHKNALGIMTKGVCDDGKQCTTAGYKKCYAACVEKRSVDAKTFYVLKNLVICAIDQRDLELGKIAKDVRSKYLDYEIKNRPALKSSQSLPGPGNQVSKTEY